jgi:hypothetical protein
MKQLIYKGFITEREYQDNDDALFIGDMGSPIAEDLMDEINEKQVSVRHWISDISQTKEELTESFLKNLFGAVDAEYTARYSEDTGYLWTDSKLNIGGHNLLDELESNIGKYIYLEIDVH